MTSSALVFSNFHPNSQHFHPKIYLSDPSTPPVTKTTEHDRFGFKAIKAFIKYITSEDLTEKNTVKTKI
jgi:hypothetical protein